MIHKMDGIKSDGKRCSRLRAYWPVWILIVVWLGLILFRDPIRARWWEIRLRTTANDVQQIHYFNLLSSVGDLALPAARALAGDEDPRLRTYGVGILHHINGAEAQVLLRVATNDSDEEVRRMAVVGLAMRKDPFVVVKLQKLAESDDVLVASSAVIAIGSYDCSIASQVLCQLARGHPIPLVRAEAVEQLGYLKCTEAIPALIEALGDQSPYDGQTMLEELDQKVLRAFAKQRSEPAEKPFVVKRARAVSDQAAWSLRLITGQSFGFDSSDEPARRQAAESAWRAWWAAQQAG